MNQTLEFTFTVSPCLGCTFCAQEALAKAYTSDKRKLSEEDFDKMISTVPKEVMIQGSGFSECLLHPDSMEMLLSAYLQMHPVGLYTTLVGLRENHLHYMDRIQFDIIRIHAPDREFLKTNEEVWLRNLDAFLELKKGFSVMAMGPLSDFVKGELDARGVLVEMPNMLSRAENLGWSGRQKITGNVTCEAQRWHQNVVLPDGTVVGCCMLYSMEVVLGNLLTDTYDTIYANGEKWRQETNPHSNSPCRVCEWGRPT